MTWACVFGDSIAWGSCDLESGGWVNRVSLTAERLTLAGVADLNIYNCGICGDRVDHVLSRFDAEAEARAPERVVLAIGINDAPHEDYAGTPLSLFWNRYETLLEKAGRFDPSPLLVGPTNVADDIPCGHSNATIEPYVETIRELAGAKGLTFVDVFGVLEHDDLIPDGLHPSAAGHAKLAALIGPEISPLLVSS